MMNYPVRIFWACLIGLLWSEGVSMAQTDRWPQAGEKQLLHEGWMARRADEVKTDGNQLSRMGLSSQQGWLKARVPGTVLTTLLENGRYPAPEYSVNNDLIPDIYETGPAFYTYWFVKEFQTPPVPAGKHIWLNFRGINYRADIFLNGKRINAETHEGMFLRRCFEITDYLHTDSLNCLAVIVYPPTEVGNPNGGQGGDGMIARNVTMQYTPGWDWIQPVRDRNTGIWDEVSLTMTGDVELQHPYVVTKVPGVRQPSDPHQQAATVTTTIEVVNHAPTARQGQLICETDGQQQVVTVNLQPFERKEIQLKPFTIRQPRLWWPNGIGEHPLYPMQLTFQNQQGEVSDRESLRYGIREIHSEKCPQTGGRKFYVNGQPIYITGGNYINSDWLLRLSPERYRTEVRFHAEMNLRMIRVWGGALLERPEFYDACDEEGMLVFQDLWGSGDCNGAWTDPMKKESRERRWEYPDNHALFLTSVEDQVKMIRNHPSLCFWCGANEWPLAKDIDRQLKEQLFPRLDPNRLFVSYSTDTLFTHNQLGDNGDGPYGIQEPEWFFTFRSHPFNPEAGSVGSPEVESMRAMMTERELREFPRRGTTRSYAWRYHKDLGYGDHLERYGTVKSIEDYCKYAQVVNYDQYRSFMEGWASHMWSWYTGILIWKTQNPWTSLRGQMYDWFLDVNASFYGTQKGCEPIHAFYNLDTRQVELLNTTVENVGKVKVKAEIFDRKGQRIWEKEQTAEALANQVQPLFEIPRPDSVQGVYFLKLSLATTGTNHPISTPNIYWLTTTPKDYTSLAELPHVQPQSRLTLQQEGDHYTGEVELSTQDQISFFNRIKLVDARTGERILPVHYSDNYITLMPGDKRVVKLSFRSSLPKEQIQLEMVSW